MRGVFGRPSRQMRADVNFSHRRESESLQKVQWLASPDTRQGWRGLPVADAPAVGENLRHRRSRRIGRGVLVCGGYARALRVSRQSRRRRERPRHFTSASSSDLTNCSTLCGDSAASAFEYRRRSEGRTGGVSMRARRARSRRTGDTVGVDECHEGAAQGPAEPLRRHRADPAASLRCRGITKPRIKRHDRCGFGVECRRQMQRIERAQRNRERQHQPFGTTMNRRRELRAAGGRMELRCFTIEALSLFARAAAEGGRHLVSARSDTITSTSSGTNNLTKALASRRQRRVGSRKARPHAREIGKRAPSFDRGQSRDRSAAIGDHDLASLLHVVEQIGDVLPDFAHTCRSHFMIVSHVARHVQIAIDDYRPQRFRSDDSVGEKCLHN